MNKIAILNLINPVHKLLACFLCLTVFVVAVPEIQAQGTCCEAYELRAENAPDLGECCFRLYVDVAGDPDCEFAGFGLEIQGEDAGITQAEDGEFVMSINNNTIIWSTCCDEGQSRYLGAICLDRGDAVYTANTLYFDDHEQQYVSCGNEILLHCTIDNGALCGTKYNDINCNGQRDVGEPGLNGWTINIRNMQNNTHFSTSTDAEGNYCFTDLELAPWVIYEDQQSGWIQTAPGSGSYLVTLSSGQTVENLDFGNTTNNCSETTETVFESGAKDNFGPNVDSPLATPSQELLDLLNGRTLSDYDDNIQNRHFANSFPDLTLDNCCIVGATLTMQIRAIPLSMAYNDRLNIVEDGRVIWSENIGVLMGVSTWMAPAQGSLVLDLANLPGNTLQSALPALRDGTLDFFLQDDTEVDWVDLNIEYCCLSECCEYLQPRYFNNIERGACCFDFVVYVDDNLVYVDDNLPCEISKVGWFVVGDINSITYAGDGSHNYGIVWNTIVVDQFLQPGLNHLGTYCIDGFSNNYLIYTEYFDENTGEWTACRQNILAECAIQDGTLCGTKFEDLNGNGERDPGEAGLAGFTITALNPANGQTVSVVTDADGNYKFFGLELVKWRIYETQQENWVQTFPATGFYELDLVSGTVYKDLDFGNTRWCDEPIQNMYIYGEMDDFDPDADDPDVELSLELIDFLAGSSPIVGFDNEQADRYFAHTFTEPKMLMDLGCQILTGTLTMQIKTIDPSSSFNDALVFVQDGQVIYSRRIGDILGTTWTQAGPVVLSVDLSDLFPAGTLVNRTTSALPSLLDGTFDLYLQDDTSVDWIALDLTFCCEPAPRSTRVAVEFWMKSSIISPNPAENELNLQFELQNEGVLHFDIVNMLGQSVATIQGQTYTAGAHALNFDLRRIEQGTYFVRVVSSAGWSRSLPFSIVR